MVKFLQESWKTCVFFLVSNKPEDKILADISSEVIRTGLRKLFTVISKEQLFKEVLKKGSSYYKVLIVYFDNLVYILSGEGVSKSNLFRW